MTASEQTKGFTLIELLVVLGIMTLILTIVPPMLPNVIAGTQVKTVSRVILSGLKSVRSQAIRNQQEMTFTLNTEDRFILIGEKQKKLTLPEETKLTLITAKSEQVSQHEGAIRFFSDGSSTGGQIKLLYRTREFTIDVNWLTGKVRILS